MKKIVAVMLCSLMFITGCNTVKLTEQEEELVGEYAATLLLSYSAVYDDRLNMNLQEPESVEPITAPPKETTPSQADDNTASSNAGADGSSDVSAQPTQPLAIAMGLSGFDISYSGYEVTGIYPNDENSFFAMNATTGNSLMVLKFQIQNTTSAEAVCDILSNQLKFRLVVNGQRINAQLTMLLNDMYAFQESIAPGEAKEAVLVFQVSQEVAAAVSGFDLVVDNAGVSSTYPLEGTAQ